MTHAIDNKLKIFVFHVVKINLNSFRTSNAATMAINNNFIHILISIQWSGFASKYLFTCKIQFKYGLR